jgi:hypothetical protein
MAQSGYTPILIYASGTTTNVPLAANLTSSANGAELALNYTDGKLFYKDNSGVVQILATKAGALGTVTSVAQSFTGGLISVSGSPITSSGTLALTVAGTSGGIPYFSSASTWATSAALAANAIVIGGGAGAAPATTTTGTGVLTALGVNTGTSGAFVVNGGVLGTPSSGTVTNLTGTASININGTVGATTPTTGAFTTVNGNTFTTGSYTLTGTAAKTLTFTNTLTLSGTDSTTMTFPSSSATVAGLGIAQTFTATNTFNQINYANNAVTVTSNAGTVPITYRLNTFTNSSAAAMTITIATASAVDGQMSIVRIYDFSAVAQTISWVNTENSTVSVPTTSNGSTTLPKTVGFMYNSQTSKWRCVASA